MSNPATAAFAPAQLHAALWAGDGARVHAVLDGRVLPDLPGRLKAAECVGWDCLQRGAQSATAAKESAYIVELARSAPFTDWLLHDAGAAFPGWGLLSVSNHPLLALREWARDLNDVRMPDGRRRPWRWWDPELLAALLPVLTPDQQDRCFALGQQLVLVAPQRWVWWWREHGVLQHDERGVLASAA